jgi:hypothetical protein
MIDSFFLSGPCADKAYANLRDLPPEFGKEGRILLIEAQRFIEELWKEFKSLADPHFKEDARNHFFQRFWEMYLGVTLLRMGYVIEKVGTEGPDFLIRLNDKKMWVEATAPSRGEGPDAVPRPVLGEVQDVPEEKILLRFTQALKEKMERYMQTFEKGIISAEDYYVIAINGGLIPYAPYGGVLPYVVNAFLAVGHPAIIWDKQKNEVVDSYFERREYITKLKGTEISTGPFLDSEYSMISGVIFSGVDPVNRPAIMGTDFIFLHNPSAKHPVSKDIFPFCRQYWLEGEELHMLESILSLTSNEPDRAS